MTKKKPNWGAIGLGIFGAIVLIVSVVVFLTNKEGYGDYKPISGWEALKLQSAGFWIIAIVLNIVGGFVVYGVVANETGGGWLGRKMEGKTSTTFFLILLAAALIFGPWGKACTDKANAGVTAPKKIACNTCDNIKYMEAQCKANGIAFISLAAKHPHK